MSYLNFDKSELINLKYSLSLELLRSNRAGSYSSTSITTCNTRKYHGLLVCPMEHLDGDKHVLLSSLDCSVIQGKSEFNLGIRKYEGDNYTPKGHKYIQDFQAGKVLQIYYRVGGVRIMRESLLVEKEQQLLIRFTILEQDKPTTLRFTPFLAFRNMHQLSKSNLHAQTHVKFINNGIKTRMYAGYPYLHMQFSKANEFVPSPDWYYNVEYLEEQQRGYDYKEDLFVPGYFEIPVRKGDALIFSAGTSESNAASLVRKFSASEKKRIERESFKDCLINSAEQFILRKDNKTEICSGFHWHGTSARNTFISMPGLLLHMDDLKTFKSICDTMVARLHNGLFPDTGPDGQKEYNSADAPLWFIWALQKYADFTGNYEWVWKNYHKAIKSIIKHYAEGTTHSIGMLPNGLVTAGEPGKALTWMNAFIEGKPVTPRTGCTVEVNALWYNAVCFGADLAEQASEHIVAKRWLVMAAKIKESFITEFWDNKYNYLADYVQGVYKDYSVRPNQILAASLPYSPLTNEMKKAVIGIVNRDLYTDRGLRSLAPNHPDYKGKCKGNPTERNEALHQGSAWPWLIEHFCEAYLKLYKKSGLSFVKSVINKFEPTMIEHGIGCISEVYDGDPPFTPRESISYATSVAALLSSIELAERIELLD